MKKGVIVSVILGMVLCMTGCGSQKLVQSILSQNKVEQTTETESQVQSGSKGGLVFDTESVVPSESVTGADTVNQSEVPAETESVISEDNISTETPEYLDVVLDDYWDSNYSGTSIMYARYNGINLRTTDYPALTNAVNAWNAEYISETQSYIDQIEQDALGLYNEYGAEHFLGPFEYESEMFIKRADDEVLSVEEVVYSYEGGAHGMTFFGAYNFDVATGAEISLEDVITDMNSLPGILATEVLEKYPDIYYWTENLEEIFWEYINPTNVDYTQEFTWTLGYDGVTFYFSNYEIASYADGVQHVTVAYSEYPQIFDNYYFLGVDDNYVVQEDRTWGGMDTDLNGDGITDYISVTRNYNMDTDYSESYDVTVNGNTFTQDTYCYDLDTYLVKSDGNSYLYVQRTVENDYQSVCVFQITESSVEYMGEFSGGMGSFTNSLNFEVTRRMDLLSTYTAMADCYVDVYGLPVESGDVYEVDHDISITSTVEITAELLDEEGNLTEVSNTFPAGTVFKFERTDGETYVDMQASDGKRCRFYTTPEWPPTVNGMDAEQSFEMLWYAG